MRSTLRFVSIAALVAAICTADAFAQDSAPLVEKPRKAEKFAEKFDAADGNHDGFLTRDEAAKGMPRAAKHFDAIDADHDGKLSRQEIAQFLATKRKARED